MPRVVPSDVVTAIDRMLPQMVEVPTVFPAVSADAVPLISALVSLVEAVPADLLVLNPGQYAELTASTAFLRALPGRFQANRASQVAHMSMTGFEHNPIAMVRAAMAACPDEAPATGTVPLSFIGDTGLRESIRLDISAAHRDLAQGEWKGATVLAGAAVEALLLWALQEHDSHHVGSAAGAVNTLVAAKTMARPRDTDPETWELQHYIPTVRHLGLITTDTVTQTMLAKNFRNLIHPGRAARLGQKCDQGTALSALAAIHLVVRDLTPP
jgi:hypothetical protein